MFTRITPDQFAEQLVKIQKALPDSNIQMYFFIIVLRPLTQPCTKPTDLTRHCYLILTFCRTALSRDSTLICSFLRLALSATLSELALARTWAISSFALLGTKRRRQSGWKPCKARVTELQRHGGSLVQFLLRVHFEGLVSLLLLFDPHQVVLRALLQDLLILESECTRNVKYQLRRQKPSPSATALLTFLKPSRTPFMFSYLLNRSAKERSTELRSAIAWSRSADSCLTDLLQEKVFCCCSSSTGDTEIKTWKNTNIKACTW